MNDLIQRASKPLASIPNPISPLTTLVQSWSQYKHTIEIETTKREAIRAQSEVAINAIREQARLLRESLQNAFAERRVNFDRSFDLLEQGLQNGNTQQVEASLQIIISLVKESPIKQAIEVVQQIKNRQDASQVIDL